MRNGESVGGEKSVGGKNWSLAKRAPVKWNAEDYSASRELTQKRQQKFGKIEEAKDKITAELAKEANTRDVACMSIRAARAHKAKEKKLAAIAARKYYNERWKGRRASLTAPFLDLNLNQRVHLYAKYHKCPHGLANNRIQKNDQSYVINCDHDMCDVNSSAEAVQCGSCGTPMTTKYTNRECHCSFYSCRRCKRAQYIYEFEDRSLRMCYDKHNTQRTQVRMTLGNTIVRPSFDSILLPKPSKEQKESRVRFLEDISKPPATSFAASVTRLSKTKPTATPIPKPKPLKNAKTHQSVLSRPVPEMDSTFVPLKDLLMKNLVETKPQGAALSSAAHPFVAAGHAIKERYTEMKNKALDKIQELELRIGSNIVKGALQTLIKEVCSTLRYFVGLLYDYCYVLNPVFLFRLWDNRKSPARFLLYLAEAIIHLKEYEKQNIEHALAVLALGKETFWEHYRDGGQGVLRTILKHKFSKLKNPSRADLKNIIRNAGITQVFRFEDEGERIVRAGVTVKGGIKRTFKGIGEEVETRAQSGLGTIMDAITNLLSAFPKSLGNGVAFLRIFFKENMPILMGIRALGDLAKLASKLVDSGMQILFGQCATAKEWIEMQVCTKDNPIHSLTTTYMTYLALSSGHAKVTDANRESLVDLRSRFYVELSAAEAYVREKGKFGMAWLQYKRALTDSFNVAPPPTTRTREPLCVVLSGGAGLGKSTLWKVLLSRELVPGERENVAQKMEDISHTWNSAAEYQPGMSNKRVIVFDDFMQNIGEVDEALNVIALCTTAPYPVTVATITGPEIKGMFCEPDAVVLCTNTVPSRAGGQLADYKALERRYDVDFEIKARYDPQDPGKHIFQIKRCPMFQSLVDKTVDLEMARNITSVLYQKKRAEFTTTSGMVEALLTTDADPVFNMGRENIPEIKEAWKHNGDFLAAYQKYVLDPQQKPLSMEMQKAPECMGGKSEIDEVIDTSNLDRLNENWSSDESGDEEVQTQPSTSGKPANWFRRAFTKEPGKNEKTANKSSKVENVITQPQSSFAQYSMEALQLIYSSCLSGIFIGAPLAVVYSFAGFIRRLSLCTYGVATSAIRGEGGYYHYLRSLFNSFLTCATTTLISGLALFAAFKLVSRSSEEESGTTRTAKAKSQIKTFDQAGISEGQQRKLINATGSVMVVNSGRTTNCVFVGGHYILVPYHLFTDTRGNLLADGDKVEITKVTWKDLMKSFLFDRKSVVRLTGNIDEALARRGDVMPKDAYREDVCLYRLPATMFSAESNIVKHFWDGSYCTTNFPVRKIDYIPYNLDHSYNGQIMLNDGVIKMDSISTPRFEGVTQRYHVLAEATYAGRDASCGSLVVRPDLQETPILGIHTAANSRGSYFHYVTRQSLLSAMSKNTVQDVETRFVHCEPQAAIAEILPKQSILQAVGRIEKPLFQPTKTDLQPSVLYELMGPAKTAPAPLTHKDPRVNEEFRTFIPFWQQMFKGYSRPFEPAFQPAELNHAYISMMEDFKRVKSQSMVPTKKLDLMECINGLTHIPQNTRMPMNTSCGFPYVQECLKKPDLFVEKEGRLYPSARIILDYEHAVKQLEQGIVPFLPYVLSLKDERLKHEKIAVPPTRIFTCGNVVGYLICRKYFYSSIMQYYHAEKRDSFCCPSLDRASFDWHYLAKHMLEVGDRGFDFDFTFWDRSLSHQLLYYSTKLLLTGLSLPPQEEAAVIEMVCSPFIIWGSTVLRGEIMPSGILVTFLVNCVANEMMHRVSWRAIMTIEHPILLPMRYYREYTRGTRGGDDTWTTVDSRVLPYYNGTTVAAFLRSRGMLVTAADKSQDIPESSNFFDLSFLKNSTKYERGAFLPVTELASLYESTYWVRLSPENNDIVKATQDNATCSLRSLYFHGEEVFNDFRDKALDREPRLVLPTYEELSVIWDTFHCFPGSHTDFASREIQEDPFTLASKEIPRVPATERAKYNMSPIQTIETFYQSGLAMTALDKEQLGTREIETTSVSEEITSIGGETLENQTVGAPGKNMMDAVGASIQDAQSRKSMPVKTGDRVVQSKNNRSEVYMNDINWDLKKLVQKFTFVTDFTWTTQNAVGDILLSLKAPKDFLVTPAQREPFDVTRYWKGTLLVKVVIKSSPFYAGGLVIGFSPFDTNPNIPAIVNMGGLIHKLSQEESLEYVIPFRWPLGFIDASSDELGTFAILVNSALRSGPDNPNSINGAVYVSVMDSEFKLPEVIPAAQYQSFKFGGVVRTRPQSGVTSTSILCDINDSPSKMPLTTMCAGEGTLGRSEISHFQDSPSDLVQLLKRWEMVSRLSIGVKKGQGAVAIFALRDIYNAALRGFDRYFGLFRGSVNLRLSLESANENFYGKICFNPVSANMNAQNPANSGLQTFDHSSMGMVTIPWTQPFFTAPTRYAGTGFLINDEVAVTIYNHNDADMTVLLNIDISVGDDFHMGVFLGTPLSLAFPSMYERVPLIPLSVTSVLTEYDATYPITTQQSGMMQFIGRAIENTLPLVEKASEMGLELDAHMITEQNQLVQQRRRPFSIACDLPVLTERFTTVNHNGMTLPDKECFGTSEPETDIYNLLQNTKSLVDRVEWLSSQEAGTVIAEYLHSPVNPANLFGIHSEVSRMFNFWTGGRIIMLDVHATQMHRGQLLLSYSTGLEEMTYADATQTYFSTLDLSEGRATVALYLPYLSPLPQHRVAYLGADQTEPQYAIGRLRVFVQNALRSTATVAPDVEIVVYEACASDFQLNVYGGTPWRTANEALAPTQPDGIPQFQRKPKIRATLPKIIRPGYDNARDSRS